MKIEFLNSVDSTNCYVRKLVVDRKVIFNEQSFYIVVAQTQTAGRGRGNNRWESPENVNLYLSIAYKPPLLPISKLLPITLVTGISATEALNSFLKDKRVKLKWPNDLIIGEKKLGGILTELVKINDEIIFIVGIGININWDNIPEQLNATSMLLESGKRYDLKEIIEFLINIIVKKYNLFINNGFNHELRAQWIQNSDTLGKTIKREGVIGKAIDIDTDGALVLELKDQTKTKIVSGIINYQENL